MEEDTTEGQGIFLVREDTHVYEIWAFGALDWCGTCDTDQAAVGRESWEAVGQLGMFGGER